MSELAIPIVARPVAPPDSWLCPLDPYCDAREGEWDRRNLASRLCHALDVAQQVVERLATNGFTDSTEPANNVRPEKVISETAFLLLAASTADRYEEVRTRVGKVARLLTPHARSERMLLGVCLEPALALDFAQAHICLGRLGYRDEAFDALLRRSMASQARSGHERVPHRTLEQEWLASIWRNARPRAQKGTQRSALQSVLGRPMDLLNGHRDDIYAFTHALMYVTDWNLNPRALPRPREAILADAEAALARCLDEQDYDLAAEVLLAWPLTGQSWSAAAAFGFRVLARVEDEAGFLPAPSTRLQRLNSLQGAERRDYLLATAYHTVYVMGLLCAAALQQGRTPPSAIPTGTPRPGSAAAIVPFLNHQAQSESADGRASCEPSLRQSHWWDEFQRLDTLESDALAGLLLNVALRRKAVQRDFGALRDLLEAAYTARVADSPAASQAAELLERVAMLARPSPRQHHS
jgi:hypothetical protein